MRIQLPSLRIVAGLGLVAAGALLPGCSGESTPRVRVGALPFPGPLTLYSTADPSKLGPHYYDDWSSRPRRPQEGSVGIVYTSRGGFLDLSHVRESADWVRYISGIALPLLMADSQDIAAATWVHQDAVYTLGIRPPEWFSELSRDERADRAGELSADIAAAATYLLMNWHEVATWHGWSTVPLVSERRSAFTWDDGVSHLVGIEVGRRVVRAGWRSGPEYDRAIAETLSAELRRLDARSPRETDAAAEAVKGLWWVSSATGGEAVRRHTGLGLDGSAIVPWTVRPASPQQRFHAPLGLTSGGLDIASCWSLRIEPPSWLLARTLGSHAATDSFDARAQMPALIERVAEQFRAEFGENATTLTHPNPITRDK